jgi:hypothetical protein
MSVHPTNYLSNVVFAKQINLTFDASIMRHGNIFADPRPEARKKLAGGLDVDWSWFGVPVRKRNEVLSMIYPRRVVSCVTHCWSNGFRREIVKSEKDTRSAKRSLDSLTDFVKTWSYPGARLYM